MGGGAKPPHGLETIDTIDTIDTIEYSIPDPRSSVGDPLAPFLDPKSKLKHVHTIDIIDAIDTIGTASADL